MTAVMHASSRGHTEVVCALLAVRGIDVNKAGNDGLTSLMRAAHQGHTKVVRALVTAPGIDLNKRATGPEWAEGRTALGLAMAYDRPEAAALLRAAGAREEGEHDAPPTATPAAGAKAAPPAAAAARAPPPAAAAAAAAVPARNLTATARGAGRQIYHAAEKGDMVALRPLVLRWGGNDVLNWGNPEKLYDGCTPLIICSRRGQAEAVKLLMAAPGENS